MFRLYLAECFDLVLHFLSELGIGFETFQRVELDGDLCVGGSLYGSNNQAKGASSQLSGTLIPGYHPCVHLSTRGTPYYTIVFVATMLAHSHYYNGVWGLGFGVWGLGFG